MTLEKFERQEIPDRPAVTIRKNGSLCINRSAIDEFNIGAMRFATLYFDEKERLIGIKPEPDNTDPYVSTISKERNRTSVISCQGFLKQSGIPYRERSRVFKATWDDKSQMILIKLDRV